jgi:hypothetical protein
MTAIRRYRDIEYTIQHHGYFLWDWTCYPRVGTPVRICGSAKGLYRDADRACRQAIDEVLAGCTVLDPTTFRPLR